MESAQARGNQARLCLRLSHADSVREAAEDATTEVLAVMQTVALRMYQPIETQRQPEIWHDHAGAGKVARRNSDDGKRRAIEPDTLAVWPDRR